ncbi:MAG: hypothetical protein MUP17_12940 [candidate division Zixibacteria bacterium]|nr:hypothetical protein [candidate division Zixibacteria bacterium]
MKEELNEIAKSELGVDEKLNEVSITHKYGIVRNTIVENFDQRTWFITDACLSVIATLLLEDITNPCGLNILDSPSTNKTTVLSFFDVEGITYKSDSFTPASFVSHSSNVKEKELPKIDLLPRIQYKCLIIPELGPVFQKRREDLIENISVLTRVFDGQGLETDSGVRGRRGYKGDYLFAWLGASTPFDFRVWNIMGKFGSRLLFLTVNDDSSNGSRINKVMAGLTDIQSYKLKAQRCKQVVSDFLEFLWRNTGGVRKIQWDRAKDNQSLIEVIAKLSNLVAIARSTVSVWREQQTDYNYNQPIIEHPFRLSSILYNLARGHAIIQGRNQINAEDIRLVIEVGLSSMPDDRRQVLNLLLNKEAGDNLKTDEIVEKLGVSNPTARAIMQTFAVLGIVDHNKPGMGSADSIRLKEDFEWFQGAEFRKLRQQPERNLSPCKEQEHNEKEIPF